MEHGTCGGNSEETTSEKRARKQNRAFADYVTGDEQNSGWYLSRQLNLSRKNKASDSKLLLAIQVWIFCRVTNIMKESAHCNFSTDCKILITSLTSTVVKYYYFGKQKISLFKMESLETTEKALRLTLLS